MRPIVMKNKKLPIALLLLLSLNVTAKSKNHLQACWDKQVKPLQDKYIEFHYSESENNLYHSFKPWDTYRTSHNGTAWCNGSSFLKRDTLQNKHISLLQYNDTELLSIGYRDTSVMNVTKEDYEQEPIELSRYSPALLLNYFHAHAALKTNKKDQKYEVYQLTIAKTVVKLFINRHTELLEKISAMSNSDLYGDVTDVINYRDYINAGDLVYPKTIYMDKTNGKAKDTININSATTVQHITPLLKKPADYKLKERIIALPDLSGTAMVVEFKDFLVVTEAPLSNLCLCPCL